MSLYVAIKKQHNKTNNPPNNKKSQIKTRNLYMLRQPSSLPNSEKLKSWKDDESMSGYKNNIYINKLFFSFFIFLFPSQCLSFFSLFYCDLILSLKNYSSYFSFSRSSISLFPLISNVRIVVFFLFLGFIKTTVSMDP